MGRDAEPTAIRHAPISPTLARSRRRLPSRHGPAGAARVLEESHPPDCASRVSDRGGGTVSQRMGAARHSCIPLLLRANFLLRMRMIRQRWGRILSDLPGSLLLIER